MVGVDIVPGSKFAQYVADNAPLGDLPRWLRAFTSRTGPSQP